MLCMFIVIESLTPVGNSVFGPWRSQLMCLLQSTNWQHAKFCYLERKVYWGTGTDNRRVSYVLNSHLFFDNLEYIITFHFSVTVKDTQRLK